MCGEGLKEALISSLIKYSTDIVELNEFPYISNYPKTPQTDGASLTAAEKLRATHNFPCMLYIDGENKHIVAGILNSRGVYLMEMVATFVVQDAHTISHHAHLIFPGCA